MKNIVIMASYNCHLLQISCLCVAGKRHTQNNLPKLQRLRKKYVILSPNEYV